MIFRRTICFEKQSGYPFKSCLHLDSKFLKHHDASMRTTVTFDKDVERMLREAVYRSRKSFKETLNAGLRAGLGERPARAASVAFVVKARSLGLRAGFDPAGFNKLADDLEVDAFLRKTTDSGAFSRPR
jgi:hypothetical protein